MADNGEGIGVQSRSRPLERGSDTPLWLQLRRDLRNLIDEQPLNPGQQLPSEARLCDEYGVSRTVVRDALRQLMVEGRIYKIKGKGAFVAEPDEEQFVGTTTGFWEEMVTKGHHVRTEILLQETRAPDERALRFLQLHPQDATLLLKRLFIVDGVPAMLVSAQLPTKLVPGLHDAKLQNRPLYETLRQRYGITPFRAERWLEALVLPQEEAGLLQVPTGSPALGIESVARLESGTPFEYYYAFCRTETSRLHILSR